MTYFTVNDAESYAIQHFAYTPLKVADYSIRILEVLPDVEDRPVQVRLSESKTPLTQRYRCVSYMWGAPSDETYDIILNECSFTVRKNLYHFLRMAGRRFSNTPLWIDAICINQQDDVEKAVSVSRMAEIYSTATETLVWLGDDAEVSSALEWLDAKSWDWSTKAAFASLEKLYANPYWTRMWICQEILLSKHVTLHTTYSQVAWTRFGAAAKSRPIKGKAVLDIRQNSNPEYYWSMWLARHPPASFRTSQQQGHQSLWDLLITLSTSGCAYQRDRIYGLLALVQNGASFDVSYTESPADLFWRAGEYFRAWARTAFMETLRLALGVDMSSLNASVERLVSKQSLYRTRPYRLTIELCCVRSSFLPGLVSSTVSCGRKGCKKYLKSMSNTRKGIILCAMVNANEKPSVPCLHVLLQPDTLDLKQEAFTTRLAIPSYSCDPILSSTKLDVDALELYTQFGWEKVKSWDFIRENSRQRKQRERWRVLVSPVVIAGFLSKMAENTRLLADDESL